MDYTVLNMENYPRRAHFEYFSEMDYPYAGITVQADVTKCVQRIRAQGYPMFLTMLYLLSQAANAVPELRQRILDNGIIQYDWCRSSHTAMRSNGVFCYCSLDARRPFDEFIPYAQAEVADALEKNSLKDCADDGDLIYTSCVPWIAYSSLIQPTTRPADSHVRLNWGKLYPDAERQLMPLSILVHHALADGRHIAAFFDGFEELANSRF